MIQSAFRKLSETLPRLLPAVSVLAILTLPLVGQEAIDYRGVWQAKAPEEGRLIFILKRNNLASYFWADNADRTVYQGSWSSDTEGALIKWDDGSSHRITPNLLGHKVAYLDASQIKRYETAMDRLPEEILGQWAKEPLRPEEEYSDRDRAKGFFGTWEVASDSEPYYLVIEPDRSAATNWTQGDAASQGLRGSWAKQGSELHISWDTGHYGVLKENERDFTFRLIAPGAFIEKNESGEQLATRINRDQVPVEWQAAYNDERQTQAGGVAFSSRKDAILFYRGSWIIQLSEDVFERIEIGRFGGLKTSKDSTLYGNWRMSGQDVFMNWDDGLRKILSPVGNGFLLYEYRPGRPIDGVPTQIFSATPESVTKLTEHMEGRKVVAERLLRLAEEAGITSSVVDVGWGQTFMRWAWPFGDQSEEGESSKALLLVDSESSDTLDPWWWPFWSEKRTFTATDPVVERNKVEITLDSKSTEADADKTESEKETNKLKKTDWAWPF